MSIVTSKSKPKHYVAINENYVDINAIISYFFLAYGDAHVWLLRSLLSSEIETMR